MQPHAAQPFLSRLISEHKTQYYRTLRRVTESADWEDWLLYMLEAIEKTAHATTHKILAIRDLLAETIEKAKQVLPKSTFSKELYLAHWKRQDSSFRSQEARS